MTRYSDLMCRDLFGCTHEPETPVVEGGEILHWLCRCGKRATWPDEDDEKDPSGPQEAP